MLTATETEQVLSKQSGKRIKYQSWMTGHKKQAFDASVDAFLNAEDLVKATQAIVPGIIILQQIFQRSLDNEIERRSDDFVDVDNYGLFD